MYPKIAFAVFISGLAALLFYFSEWKISWSSVQFARRAYLSYKLGHENLPRNSSSVSQREQFELVEIRADVAMVGDSLIQSGNWNELFPGKMIVNRGVGGDRTDDLLVRTRGVLRAHPRKIFLLVGINDLFWHRKTHIILRDYFRLTQALSQGGAKLYVQSILECAKESCGIDLEEIRAINDKLRDHCNKNGFTFIDLNAVLSGPDGLLEKYHYDGVHLRGEAYLKWRDLIAPYVFE